MFGFHINGKSQARVLALEAENLELRRQINELKTTVEQKDEEHAVQRKFLASVSESVKEMMGNPALRLHGDDGLSPVINKVFENLDEKMTNIVYAMVRVAESNRHLDRAIEILKNRNREQVALIKDISTANRDFTGQTETISRMGKELETMARQTAVVSDEGSRMLLENLEIFESVGRQIDENTRFMNELSGSIKSVSRLTDLITDIAERLKLLAINASIEAARSGEAGKGFSVVAEYMKVLSEDTAKSVNEVTVIMNTLSGRSSQMEDALSKIQNLVINGNELFSSGISKFNWICEGVKEFREYTGNISSALESQFIAVSQIASSTDTSLEFGEEVLKINDEVNLSAVSLDHIVQEVVEEVSSFKLSLHQMALESLLDVIKQLPGNAEWTTIQHISEKILKLNSYFELLYVMDNRGIQQTDNIVNPMYREVISKSGKGEDRSGKDYFTEVQTYLKPYVSKIYLSSATGNLCITVSAPLFTAEGTMTGVLAGDINLHNRV